LSAQSRANRSAIAHTRLGRDSLAAGTTMQRHRHAIGYVAVVLAGGYLESGDAGRRRVGPGDALVHRAFESHLDRIGPRGAVVVNVPFPVSLALPDAFRVRDADAVARAAESDIAAASDVLAPSPGVVPAEDDWPDRLAALLRVRSDVAIAPWADAMGLAPETVSRGFRAAFGVPPARYRAEARARRAFAALCENDDSLVEIALACGFADQSHLSRAIAELTGISPSAWRRNAH
jgi:AraC-like DNA-binding protein